MEKPITIARDEFMKGIAKVINESHLPAFVIADALELLLGNLRRQEIEQLEADKEQFESAKEN